MTFERCFFYTDCGRNHFEFTEYAMPVCVKFSQVFAKYDQYLNGFINNNSYGDQYKTNWVLAFKIPTI
jgi:hypothetical protein